MADDESGSMHTNDEFFPGCMRCQSQDLNASRDLDPATHPSHIHPLAPAVQFLRQLQSEALPLHLMRWLYQVQSMHRAVHTCKKAVDYYWYAALDLITVSGVPKLFKQTGARERSSEYLLLLGDIIKNTEKDVST